MGKNSCSKSRSLGIHNKFTFNSFFFFQRLAQYGRNAGKVKLTTYFYEFSEYESTIFFYKILPEGMCKPLCVNQDFPPLANRVYFILIIKKTPLRNGNLTITDHGSGTQIRELRWINNYRVLLLVYLEENRCVLGHIYDMKNQSWAGFGSRAVLVKKKFGADYEQLFFWGGGIYFFKFYVAGIS